MAEDRAAARFAELTSSFESMVGGSLKLGSECEIGIATCFDGVTDAAFRRKVKDLIERDPQSHSVLRWFIESFEKTKSLKGTGRVVPIYVGLNYGSEGSRGPTVFLGAVTRFTRKWTSPEELSQAIASNTIDSSGNKKLQPVHLHVRLTNVIGGGKGEKSAKALCVRLDIVWERYDIAGSSTGIVAETATFVWDQERWVKKAANGP